MEDDGALATSARLQQPFAVALDSAGANHFIAEMGNRIRRVDRAGVITTVVGPGAPGQAGQVELDEPHHLIVSPGSGDLYIGDTFNRRMLRYQPRTSTASPFAEQAGVARAFCLAFDRRGERLYVADTDHKVIRAIDMSSLAVSVVAGNGQAGRPEDNARAVAAPLVDPRAIALDGKGNLYILERNGNALRVLDSAGRIRTVAGTGQPGHTGDGGDARAATLNGPKHLTVDLDDNVLIADTENHVIRKVLVRENRIVRVAGTGMAGGADALPAPPTEVSLRRPHGVMVAPDGALFIADSWNDRVLKIE